MPTEEQPVSLDEALILLRTKQQEEPDKFKPGFSEAEIEAFNAVLPISIPLAWRKVLHTSSDFFGYSWEIGGRPKPSVSLGPTFMEELSPPRLVIAGNSFGDYLTLETVNTTSEGDCAVAEISHDGVGESRWESVGEFLQWAITHEYGE